MPTVGKSAKVQREQKCYRIKLMLDELKTPKSSEELEKVTFGTLDNRNHRRVLQNYLSELKGIGIITYDADTNLYSLSSNKLDFKNKAEYELSGKHAHDIFYFTMDETDVSYFWDERILLRLLSFYEEDYKVEKEGLNFGTDSDNHYAHVYLLQHIRTGYPEISALIDKYKQLLIKHGINSGYSISESEGLIEHIPEEPKIAGLTESEEQELTNIVDMFVQRFLRLRRDAKECKPLVGHCDGCPTSRVTIKGG